MQKNTDRHYMDVSGSTSFCIDSVKSRTSPGNDEGMCNICSLILGAGWSAERWDLGEFAKCRPLSHPLSFKLLQGGQVRHVAS